MRRAFYRALAIDALAAVELCAARGRFSSARFEGILRAGCWLEVDERHPVVLEQRDDPDLAAVSLDPISDP